MGDLIHFRDYQPKYRACTAYPVTQPAMVVFLPMVMIDHGDGTQTPWVPEEPPVQAMIEERLPKSVAARMRRLRKMLEHRKK